jgi:hypothetical protein
MNAVPEDKVFVDMVPEVRDPVLMLFTLSVLTSARKKKAVSLLAHACWVMIDILYSLTN